MPWMSTRPEDASDIAGRLKSPRQWAERPNRLHNHPPLWQKLVMYELSVFREFVDLVGVRLINSASNIAQCSAYPR